MPWAACGRSFLTGSDPVHGAGKSCEEPSGRAASQLLAIPNYRRLVAGFSLGFAAFNIRLMAQSWLVLDITDSALWVGVVAGASTVTVMAFSLVAGALADRMDRKLLILTSRIAQAAVVFALAFLVTSGRIELWLIVVLSVAGGLSLAVMGPAGETLLMDIAGKERLLTASAVQSLVGSLSQFGAPAAAGVIIATVGVEAVFYSAGAVLVVASVLIARIRLPQVERPKAQPMLRALIEGLRYVAHTPHVAWLVFVASVALFAGVFMPLVPVYARDVLLVGAKGFGLLEASWGLGTLVGAAWLLSLGNVRRKGRMVIMAAVAFGASMIIFGFSREFYLSLTMMFILGLCPPFWMAGIRTILQTTIPDEMRGRVMAVFLMGLQFVGLGWPLGGAMAEAIGNEATLAAGWDSIHPAQLAGLFQVRDAPKRLRWPSADNERV